MNIPKLEYELKAMLCCVLHHAQIIVFVCNANVKDVFDLSSLITTQNQIMNLELIFVNSRLWYLNRPCLSKIAFQCKPEFRPSR